MTLAEIDRAALAFADRVSARQPLALNGIVGFSPGPGTRRSRRRKSYQDAIDQQNAYYTGAENKIVNAAGSPAAQQFANLEIAADRPAFAAQNNSLLGTLASKGILSSGAGKADLSDLSGQQDATIAGQVAPLYSQALSAYDSLLGNQANTESGTRSTEASAGNDAYNNAVNQFYNAVQFAATGKFGSDPTNSQPNPYSDQGPVGPSGNIGPEGTGDAPPGWADFANGTDAATCLLALARRARASRCRARGPCLDAVLPDDVWHGRLRSIQSLRRREHVEPVWRR